VTSERFRLFQGSHFFLVRRRNVSEKVSDKFVVYVVRCSDCIEFMEVIRSLG